MCASERQVTNQKFFKTKISPETEVLALMIETCTFSNMILHHPIQLNNERLKIFMTMSSLVCCFPNPQILPQWTIAYIGHG